MAGKGLRRSECKESIMQWERFKALRAVKVARLSGICVNRFVDKSSDQSVSERGIRLTAETVVNALSARLRCLRNLHLFAGTNPDAIKFEALCLGLCQESDMLDCEEPDPERLTL